MSNNTTIMVLVFRKVRKKSINLIDRFRTKFKLYDSEDKLKSDNQDYWNQDYSNPILAQDAHWKNNGKFEDMQRWLSLGKEHLDLITKYASVLDAKLPVDQIVEWGCGGGANAVHFAPLTKKFIGIDITSESLEECKKQVLECGFNNFYPILINASTPESILEHKIKNVDLFICTYVFEQFPSPAYGITILKLANRMLASGGIAFIQIKYGIKSRHLSYKHNPYSMTVYTLEEFWETSREVGFEPLGIYLKPYQPLVTDKKYAYFYLKKNKEI